MKKPIIGITIGALGRKGIYQKSKPLVIASKPVIEDAIKMISSDLRLHIVKNTEEAKGEYGMIDLLDLDNITLDEFEYGKVNKKAGQASLDYIYKGIELAMSKKIDAVVHPGHTEIFATQTNTKDYAMMLADKHFRVIHVSTHVSLRKACDLVKKQRVLTVIRLADKALKDLGIQEPKIGVAGLNPHAGEGGLFGNEEIDEIIPAINEAKQQDINVEGPIPPDTIFGSNVP